MHNGWSAPGGADINDPAYFVNKNAQPGTTWDMYGVKASESLTTSVGSLGSRLANRSGMGFAAGKESKHKQLTTRLMTALRSAESKGRFEANGFHWLPVKK